MHSNMITPLKHLHQFGSICRKIQKTTKYSLDFTLHIVLHFSAIKHAEFQYVIFLYSSFPQNTIIFFTKMPQYNLQPYEILANLHFDPNSVEDIIILSLCPNGGNSCCLLKYQLTHLLGLCSIIDCGDNTFK